MNDDGNDQDYMCALRLATTRSADEHKSLPQSARSRCVQPKAITKGQECLLAEAKWNEVFVFELPQKVIVGDLQKKVVCGYFVDIIMEA